MGVSQLSEGGYRIASFDNQPFLAQSGLQPGDVVLSGNGRPLGDIGVDRLALTNLANAGSVSFGIAQRANAHNQNKNSKNNPVSTEFPHNDISAFHQNGLSVRLFLCRRPVRLDGTDRYHDCCCPQRKTNKPGKWPRVLISENLSPKWRKCQKNFVVDPRLKGQVNVVSQTPLGERGYELFLSTCCACKTILPYPPAA